MIDVRSAEAEDVESIAALHLRSATTAYRGILPDGAEAPALVTLEAEWHGTIVDPRTSVLVAQRDGAVVGVVVLQHASDQVMWAELRRLYVGPDAWRLGIGSRLHDSLLEIARERNVSTVSLWVLERNDRARRFYETRGWARVDGAFLEWPELGVREVRYERGP